MEKLILFISLFLTFFVVGTKSAPPIPRNGVTFVQTSLAGAIQLAKMQKKLIFIEVYTAWCPPCIMLKVKTFPNKNAGLLFNTNFINLSLNGERDEGRKLAQTYRLNAFPPLIILNSDGSPLLATEGYLDAKTLIEFGEAGIARSKK